MASQCADIFVGKFLSGGQRELLLFLDGLAGGHRGAHAVHRVDRVNRRGPRGLERLIDDFNVRWNFRRSRPRKASAPWANP